MQEIVSAMKPKVSVIIPSYNKSDYIAETLNSLIDQDYDKWEAINSDYFFENIKKSDS